jgi:drug/metabolite transporter (DMT)-like permease
MAQAAEGTGGRRTRLDPAASGILLLCCASWGLQQTAIKLAAHGIAPVLQAGVRSILAIACLLVWARLRGVRLDPRDGTFWPGLAAGLLFGAEFAAIYTGLQFTTAARSVVFIYTAPFFIAVGCHLFVPGERMSRAQVLGLALAFAGILAAFAEALALPTARQLVGDALAILAAALWGATTIVIKRSSLATADPAKTLAWQLGVSAVALPLLSLALGESWEVRLDAVVVASLLYQGVLVAFLSYLAWFWLVTRYPATRLAAFTFVTPLFGVAGGALVLGEPLTPGLLVAATLVAVGIYVVNRPRG